MKSKNKSAVIGFLDTTFDSELIWQAISDFLSQYLYKEMLITIDPFETVQLAYVSEVCIKYKK